MDPASSVPHSIPRINLNKRKKLHGDIIKSTKEGLSSKAHLQSSSLVSGGGKTPGLPEIDADTVN